MRRISLSSLILTLFLSFNVFAGTQNFEKRFELVRKDGRLVKIIDQGLKTNFKIAPYIKFIKEQLIQEQELLASKANYDADIEALLLDGSNEKSSDSAESVAFVIDSMKALGQMDIDKIFANPGFAEVISKFESKLGAAMDSLDPNVLAALDNPRYFYKRNATYQIVKWGLNFAKKRLSSIPVLNTASFVLVQVEKMIREKRLYHQNILLHYFETYSSQELGLTNIEIDHAYSSIYESRIPWFAIWESNQAVNNWDKFGVNKFFQSFRMATNRFRSHRSLYSSVGDRLNYGFQEVEYKESNVIINLFDKEGMFANRPAVSFFYNGPKKVLRKRVVLQLAQLGLSFLSLPEFIKNFTESYMKSHYETQQITEGALFGHFEALEDHEMLKKLQSQYINPFDQNLIL